MLTELYIEALLADEALTDGVWALWDAGVNTDGLAAWAWLVLASRRPSDLRNPPSAVERGG